MLNFGVYYKAVSRDLLGGPSGYPKIWLWLWLWLHRFAHSGGHSAEDAFRVPTVLLPTQTNHLSHRFSDSLIVL